MTYSEVEITVNILFEGIKVFQPYFTNNLFKDNEGNYHLEKNFKNDDKNTLEQIILSTSLNIFLLESDNRFKSKIPSRNDSF